MKTTTRLSVIRENVLHNSTPRRVTAAVLGNVILGIGVGALKLSGMGNDPFCAATMAVSDGLHIGLGNFQLLLNLVLSLCLFIWGYRHIGLGTLFNMCLTGYVIQFSQGPLEAVFGSGAGRSLPFCLGYMLAALLVASFGLSMYQKADLGMAPYDFFSIGMTEHFHSPYFISRIITDGTCVCVILLSVALGLVGWENSHLGIGTVVCAFCLGPFVGSFDKLNEKWIHEQESV